MDRLTAIKLRWDDGRPLTRVCYTEDTEWLIAEVERLREQVAESYNAHYKTLEHHFSEKINGPSND